MNFNRSVFVLLTFIQINLQMIRILFNKIVRKGGDPSGTGRGGSSIYGDTFHDEVNAQGQKPL